MAKQLLNKQGITPSRYTESHAPQFQGGQIDPGSGNVVPAGQSPAPQQAVAQEVGELDPARPTTRLGDIGMEESEQPDTLTTLAATAAPMVGADIGSGMDAGKTLGEATTATVGKITSMGGTGKETAPLGGEAGKSSPPLGGSSAQPMGVPASQPNPWMSPDVAAAYAQPNPWMAPSAAAAYAQPNPWMGAPPAASSAAAPSAVSGFGALGAGLGTFAGGLLMGQKPKDAAIAGVGSGVGFAIGNFLLPGIGGMVGSFLGGLFCHAAGTKIRMADMSWKNIEDLRVGDVVALGGRVIARGEALTTDLYSYKDVLVDGHHAVFEDGVWLRVKDSKLAEAVVCEEPATIYPVVTEAHLLLLETHVAADLAEIDQDLGGEERLERLNAYTTRNEWLSNYVFKDAADLSRGHRPNLRVVEGGGQRASAP